MLRSFAQSAVVFHAAFASVCLWFWARRNDGGLAARALVVGVSAPFMAMFASVMGLHGGFVVLRLLSQALFGELLVLMAALGVHLAVLRERNSAFACGILSLAVLGIYVDAYHLEPEALHVREHTVVLARAPLRPLRLVHLSDLQTDGVGGYEERVLRATLAEAPDLIVLTGDYVQPRLEQTRERTEADLRALLRRMAFRAPLGVYAVRGDTDRNWPESLDETGIVRLSGEARMIPLPEGSRLGLIGLTLTMSHGDDVRGLVRLVRNAPAADVTIAFGHSPNFAEVLAREAPVDLVLAGHTHGGQVVLPFFGAPFTKMRLPREYASGLHDYLGRPLHVSSGIGMERGAAPQIRFNCPPEVCVLTLRRPAEGEAEGRLLR